MNNVPVVLLASVNEKCYLTDHHSEYGGLPALSVWKGETESSTAAMSMA